MRRPPRIMITAGEASGDRLGAGLAHALRERRDDLELVGMGGPAMREAGVRLVQDSDEVAVVGLVEVLSHLGRIRRAMARLEAELRDGGVDLLVPIDFPDFNINLAGRAERLGIPVVYFVSPQVWAWRRGRVKTLARRVRRMLVLFPFETGFYETAGVPVTFVGHPVVEPSERPSVDTLRARAGLAAGKPTVALMPGSRRGEMARLWGPMADAAARVRRRIADAQLLLPLAPGLPDEPVHAEARRHGLDDLIVHRSDFPEILSTCDAGVVASGTASLEAAVEGLPIVVVYRMNPVTYALARRLIKLEHVALPNLIAGREVVPELIQARCTGERIAAELLDYLERPERAREVREALGTIRERLGGPGVFDRAADAVLEELRAESAVAATPDARAHGVAKEGTDGSR